MPVHEQNRRTTTRSQGREPPDICRISITLTFVFCSLSLHLHRTTLLPPVRNTPGFHACGRNAYHAGQSAWTQDHDEDAAFRWPGGQETQEPQRDQQPRSPSCPTRRVHGSPREPRENVQAPAREIAPQSHHRCWSHSLF